MADPAFAEFGQGWVAWYKRCRWKVYLCDTGYATLEPVVCAQGGVRSSCVVMFAFGSVLIAWDGAVWVVVVCVVVPVISLALGPTLQCPTKEAPWATTSVPAVRSP